MSETGGAHLALGYVLSRQDELDEARRELDAAREIFERTQDTKDLTRTLNELARVVRLEERRDEARELLERSIGLLGTSDDPILAWAHLELARVFQELGDRRRRTTRGTPSSSASEPSGRSASPSDIGSWATSWRRRETRPRHRMSIARASRRSNPFL